ncbi:thioesterase family protein [Actinotalea ferrariae]|uniref:acyl-CoA thioesterase n=1 Tax=Actinotalea ferrariae TaxID=1386098 RepID=UPI001C8C16E7|nr:thioesterase family protein [Actinotalea ferrariae]MBX9245934.1 thioesterase family protein [Actinotalea ferrariae]
MTRLHVPVPLRWADLDAYGHVNNVEVLRLLEEARIAAFWRHGEDVGTWPTAVLDAGPSAGTHTLVARHEVEYLLPVAYRREPLVVEMWVGRLGGASIDVCYQLTTGTPARAAVGPAGGGPVFVQAASTLVLIDAATERPRRITAEERAVWEPYVEEPVAMRRRPERSAAPDGPA